MTRRAVVIPVTDDFLIDLYKNGWSQKAIIEQYKIPVNHLRKILTQSGFITNSYKKISDFAKEIIFAFARVGYSVQNTANYTDLSFYVVRDTIENSDLKGVAAKVRAENVDKKPDDVDEKTLNEIVAIYTKGEIGLVGIATNLKLSADEIVKFVPYLTTSYKAHLKNMKLYILSQYYSGLPISTIAKQMYISRSLVKEVVYEHLD